MPSTVQPVLLLDSGWQIICFHLLLREAWPRQSLHGADGRQHGTPNESGFTGPEKAISWAASATTSAARGNSRFGAAAIMGAARLASGEVTADTPLRLIRVPMSTGPQITNIVDQASRRT
jgi:hypothetical protein